MILDEYILECVTRHNLDYYKKTENKNIKIGDDINILVKNLYKGSHRKIKVKCDVCGKLTETECRYYWKSFNNGKYYACSSECSYKKHKNTMLDKYGVDHNMKLQRCLDQRVETYQKNYGVDNPTQNKEILEKALHSSNKIKNYKKTELYYQGTYELDFLKNYYDKIKIENGKSIKYIHNNENKYYLPDFYLPNYNLVIEIKSTYYYKLHEQLNISKKEYTLKNGYNFIIIMDKNYDEFNKLINVTT